MVRMSVIVAMIAMVACSVALTHAFPQSSFHGAGHAGRAWKKGSRATAAQDLCFTIHMKHTPEQQQALNNKFWAVSDPKSSEYGKHLSQEEVTNLVAAEQSNLDAVENWLRTVPLTSLSHVAHKDTIHACMPATSAEKLLGTEFHQYEHDLSGHKGYRASTPLNVPTAIQNRIDFIGGANTPIHRFKPEVKSAMDHTKQSADTPSGSMAPVSKADEAESKLAPVLTQVIGGYQEIAVHFRVFCSNEALNTDLEVPCSSAGPYVAAFELLVTTQGHGDRLVTVPPTVCSGPDCVVTLESVRNYAPVTVRVNTKYSDDSYSGFSKRSYVVYGTDYATPAFLKHLYGIPIGLEVKNRKSSQSVAEFLEQYYSIKDLDTYMLGMGVVQQRVARLIGPNNETEGSLTGGESQLDIQVMMGVAVNAETWFWSVPGRQHHTHQEPFLHWLMAVANTTDAPLVHSVSYADDELSYEPWYVQRVDIEFQKMGLRGMTVLVASGDDGVGSGDSRQANGKRIDCDKGHPGYPSSSPYVLAIGGTQLTDQGTPICERSTHGLKMTCSNLRERGCSSGTGGVITSGGGFSNIFPRPAYQHRVVEQYLSARDVNLPPAAFYNRSGRGYPDISAYSSNYITIMNSQVSLSSGTSASTPLIGAMITFWNDMLISANLPPLGFFNPRLYAIYDAHPEAFNDVVTGNNRCGIYGVDCCPNGFEAHAGWDPITGLGTPRFGEIATILLQPNNLYPFVVNSGVNTNDNRAGIISPAVATGSGVYASIVGTLAALLAAFAVYKVMRVAAAQKDIMRSYETQPLVAPGYGSAHQRA